MADTAVAEDLAGQGAGEAAAPQGAEAPTSAQPEGSPEAKPEGQPEGGQPTTPPLEEPHVPWIKFREARQRGSQLQQELEQYREEATQKTQQLQAEYENYKQQITPQIDDYREISSALQANPDIAQMLLDRIAQGGGGRTSPVAGPPIVGRSQPAPQNDELLSTIREMKAELDQQRQYQEELRQGEAKERLSQAFDAEITKFLEGHGYDRTYLADARDYLLTRGLRELPTMGLEDVGPMLSRWYRDRESLIQQRVNKLIEGKRQDANLPAAPGGAQGPIRPAPQLGANDGNTATQLAEQIRQRLGWSG